MKMKKRRAVFMLGLLTACRSNQEIIQQASRSLAEQSRQVTPPPPANTFPWGPVLLILFFSVLVLGAISAAVWLYRQQSQAMQRQQDATFKAQKAQLRAERSMLQSMLPPPTPPQEVPHSPYQTPYPPPQEPPRQW
jgi:hypothetical protein